MAQGRYTRVAAAFHWAIAALVLLATGLALFRETFEPYAAGMIFAHKATGLLILFLSLGRLAWRLTHRPPPLSDTIGRIERVAASIVHFSLYAFMIGVPVAGWVFVSFAPATRPLDYRGPEGIPELPVAPDDATSFFWHEIHEVAGFAFIALFALHVAGALRHRLTARDDLPERMLWRSRGLALFVFSIAALWTVGLALDFFGVRFWN